MAVMLSDAQAISIHAPARGATRYRRFLYTEIPKFQSTLPRGERPSTIDFPSLV